MDLLLQLQSICVFVFLALLCKAWTKKNTTKIKGPIQPPGALPLIGHLHLLKGPKPLAQLLADLADKHGPTFMLRLGMQQVLVVSSYEGVKDCFTTNDKALASRPSFAAGKHMGYDCAMVGFAPYGSYWRSLRKITTIELLSNTRLEALKHVRANEINIGMKELHELWLKNNQEPFKIDIMRWLGDLNYNIAVNMVAGKRYFGTTRDGCDEAEAWKFRNAVTRFFKLLTAFVVSDMFPLLKGIDLNGNEAAMKAAAKDMDVVMTSLLEEHRFRKNYYKDGKDKDFMDIMISTMKDPPYRKKTMKDPQFSELDADKVIKSTSLAMIFGGTENNTKTITFALAALLSNPDILKKVQDELETHVGKNRVIEESDIKNLSYLHAVVKETFRRYPPSDLNVPHEAIEDCEIQGSFIPAGTQIFVNIWKLHQDPSVWSDPLEFKPERFLSGNIDVRGKNFELIPFGSGRRACPGISFALQVIHLTLARLIQGFELQLPSSSSVETVSRYLAFDNSNLDSLEITLTPRLSMNLYN